MQAIRVALANALKKLDITVESADVHLEFPGELSNGDYASNVALMYAKTAGMAPKALAEKIAAGLGAIEGVANAAVAGPGFINFSLSSSAIASVVDTAGHSNDWGKADSRKGEKIMVEYTDPNPFKEFHIGHLMSNAIGEATSRLLDFTGAEVKRANYQGDVGPHVAKAIWGVQKLGVDASNAKELGKAYTAGAEAYENDPRAKEEIDAINAKVYNRSDTAINDIYDAGRKASLEHFEEIYKTLGTQFDFMFFESKSAPRGMETVKAHPEVFEQSDGALVFKGEKYNLHTRVFVTSKGLPTYEAKDLGLIQLKAEAWKYDTSITVTATEQKEYFKVVLAAMKEVLPELAAKVRHVSHGMMRLAEGKMSSRKGNVITGESLLADLTEAALERAKTSRASDAGELAKQIAVGAIKYQILKQASGKDITFDRERSLSLEGDSGPYLQYAHARACAVLEKAKGLGIEAKADTGAEPNDVGRLIPRFPDIVARAAKEMEPHLVTNYLLELVSTFNRWYAQEHILDDGPNVAHKLAIVEAFRTTVKNGLWVLAIPSPEKM